jgi:hypothetical protein
MFERRQSSTRALLASQVDGWLDGRMEDFCVVKSYKNDQPGLHVYATLTFQLSLPAVLCWALLCSPSCAVVIFHDCNADEGACGARC